MTHHLAATVKRVSSRIFPLKKIRSFMDSKTTKLRYQSLIVPTLTYGSLSLYGSAPPYIRLQIEKIEDRAQLIIGNSETIPKAETTNKKHLCTFVHKCLHSEGVFKEFKDYFKVGRTNANTRHNGTNIEIPKIKLETARKSTYYQGATIFNELPTNLREETDFRIFKKVLHQIF